RRKRRVTDSKHRMFSRSKDSTHIALILRERENASDLKAVTQYIALGTPTPPSPSQTHPYRLAHDALLVVRTVRVGCDAAAFGFADLVLVDPVFEGAEVGNRLPPPFRPIPTRQLPSQPASSAPAMIEIIVNAVKRCKFRRKYPSDRSRSHG